MKRTRAEAKMKFKSSITQLENLRAHLTSTMKQADDAMPGCEAKSQDLVKINKNMNFY